MTTTVTPTYIFADAVRMHESALERMAAGDIRDAAEKAWCATLRATEALVLARTDQKPARSTQASRRLTLLAQDDLSLEELRQRYNDRQNVLHGDCFYHKFCPMPGTERLIRQTAEYIQDARRFAGE
jgi:hypothetical protein